MAGVECGSVDNVVVELGGSLGFFRADYCNITGFGHLRRTVRFGFRCFEVGRKNRINAVAIDMHGDGVGSGICKANGVARRNRLNRCVIRQWLSVVVCQIDADFDGRKAVILVRVYNGENVICDIRVFRDDFGSNIRNIVSFHISLWLELCRGVPAVVIILALRVPAIVRAAGRLSLIHI